LLCTTAVELTTDKQAAVYACFGGPPSPEQLERYFLLDDADLLLVDEGRRDHSWLGFAIQTSARFLGTFLPDPVHVPWPVVESLAGHLGIAGASCAKHYAAHLLDPYPVG
jgi:hypothetical protein